MRIVRNAVFGLHYSPLLIFLCFPLSMCCVACGAAHKLRTRWCCVSRAATIQCLASSGNRLCTSLPGTTHLNWWTLQWRQPHDYLALPSHGEKKNCQQLWTFLDGAHGTHSTAGAHENILCYLYGNITIFLSGILVQAPCFLAAA